MRRFGTDMGDLDVDFNSRAPFVATELLRRCAELTDSAAWDLPVGTRIEALVTLATLSAPGALAIALRCPQPACREALEIEISPEELRAWCIGTERDATTVNVRGRNIELRRPTGRDQRDWLAAHWPDAGQARRGVLRSLMPDATGDELDAEILAQLETELARIDPLVGMPLAVACPACGVSSSHPLNLERQALAKLQGIQARMMETVVRLAARFHWTESEIFALPAWRRERYLALAETAS